MRGGINRVAFVTLLALLLGANAQTCTTSGTTEIKKVKQRILIMSTSVAEVEPNNIDKASWSAQSMLNAYGIPFDVKTFATVADLTSATVNQTFYGDATGVNRSSCKYSGVIMAIGFFVFPWADYNA